MVWMDGCRQKAFAPFPTNYLAHLSFYKTKNTERIQSKDSILEQLA
jgi:hypothetical protein